MSFPHRRRQAGSVAAVLLAALVAGAAAVFVVMSGHRGIDRPLAGPEGERIAELLIGTRAEERFGMVYPTIAAGWRAPGLAKPVLSRPPGVDFAARAAFVAAGPAPAAARAVALGAAALTVIAIARLAWIGWGAWAAAAGAVLFAVLPYTRAYAAHPHGGMPALAAALMSLGSMLHFRRKRARIAAVSAVAWMLVAGLFDWSAYLLLVPLGALAVAGRALEGRRAGRGKVAETRVQVLGLPQGLQGPLANILMRREGETAVALTTALAIAAGGELLLFLIWFAKLGALGAFFRTFGGGAIEPFAVAGAPPGPLSGAAVGAAGKVVVAAWFVATVARVLIGRNEGRSVPAAVLLAAGGLFALLFPGLVRASFHLPALAAGGFVLAALDLASVVGALAARRKLVVAEPPPAALAVSSAMMLALAALAVPRGAAASAGEAEATTISDRPVGRALVRTLADTLEVGDRMLLVRGFPVDRRFLLRVDRDVEMVPGLAGLAERRAGDPRSVVLFAEPIADDDRPLLGALLREHPAGRFDTVWLLDLRRYDPGVQSYGGDRAGAVAERPWDALQIDLTYGVSPSLDHVPEIGGDLRLPRDQLLAYYNLHNARGPNPERDRAHAALLEGFSPARRWMDPAPLGIPAGIRWDAGQQRLDVVWECPEAAPALPPGVAIGGARFVLRPADRAATPFAVDRPIGPACPARARPGQLVEQSFPLKLPGHGRWHVAVQLLREGKPRRALNPAPVEIGVVGPSP